MHGQKNIHLATCFDSIGSSSGWYLKHINGVYTLYYGRKTSLFKNYGTFHFLYIQFRIKICDNSYQNWKLKFKNLLDFRIGRCRYLNLCSPFGRSRVEISCWVKRKVSRSVSLTGKCLAHWRWLSKSLFHKDVFWWSVCLCIIYIPTQLDTRV